MITEAREGGTAGIFDSSGGMRTGLIGEIATSSTPATHHLRGADARLPGLVRQAVRPVGEPREHPARRGHSPRDARGSDCAATR